jgi:hypothetical protein
MLGVNGLVSPRIATGERRPPGRANDVRRMQLAQVDCWRVWGSRVSMGSMVAAGVLGSSVAGLGAPLAKHQPSRTDVATQALLARAEQNESQIRSGRVLLTRTTEYNPMSEQELRQRIKDPKQLQVELAIAKSIPRRMVEQETIRFDNRRNRLLAETKRPGGQVAINRALFTPAFLKTYTESPGSPPGEREHADIYKPEWPPHSPHDRWQGRWWRGRIAALRKGQIVARRWEKDPRTGMIVMLLAGGPGAQLDQKLWIDPARGYTIARLQWFDRKSGRMEDDERAHYRRIGGLWYPDRLVTTYYRYDSQGRRKLSRRESSVVREARLNVALPDATFAFRMPRGTFVQDNRVNPPLVYREGITIPQQVQRQQQKRSALRIGQPAPEFELTSLSGEMIRLADLRGRVVVLNMFALW